MASLFRKLNVQVRSQEGIGQDLQKRPLSVAMRWLGALRCMHSSLEKKGLLAIHQHNSDTHAQLTLSRQLCNLSGTPREVVTHACDSQRVLHDTRSRRRWSYTRHAAFLESQDTACTNAHQGFNRLLLFRFLQQRSREQHFLKLFISD
jgi:hypothetical protein